MSVVFDSMLESATFTTTTPHTFTGPSPVGTPRAALVLINVNASASDLIDGAVTYGGVAMTRVATNGFAADTVTELGAVWAYFLGAGIPVGAQTVSISHTGAAATKWAICHLFTAAADTEIAVSGKLEANQANPQIALDSGATASLRAAVAFSGNASVTDLTPVANVSTASSLDSNDWGVAIVTTGYQTSAASSGSFTIGWTAGTDDLAMIAVAIQEVAGTVVAPVKITTVAALPTPAILAASTVTTAVVPVVASLPTPVIAVSAVVTPAAIVVVAALPTPSVLAGANTTPAVIPLAVTLPIPTALGATNVTPAVIPLAALLPTPIIEISESATVLPASIAVVVSLPTPAAVVEALVTPAGVTLVVTIPTPTVGSPGLVTPAGISLIVTLPTPGQTSGAITFWAPDPVDFVRVGPGDEPPWN